MLHHAKLEAAADEIAFQIAKHLKHHLPGVVLDQFGKVQIHPRFRPPHRGEFEPEFGPGNWLQVDINQVRFHDLLGREVDEVGKLQSDPHP